MDGRVGAWSSVLQANCQRSYAVMCELSQNILEDSIEVCLFQEPYVCKSRVCSLPARARVFVSVSGGASVAVFGKMFEC